MSDSPNPTGNDSRKSAYLIFRRGGATQRRTNESVTSPFVAAEEKEVADDFSNQGGFQSLHGEKEVDNGKTVIDKRQFERK